MVTDSLDLGLEGTVFAVGTSCRRRSLTPEKLTCRDAIGRVAREFYGEGDVALVFGNERNGLSIEELGKCHVLATIPSSDAYSSLNLSHAVQIFCYEIFQLKNTLGRQPFLEKNFGHHEDVELCLRKFENVMKGSGFLKPGAEGKVMERLQRLFRRTRIEKEEIDILLGFLKTIR